MICCGHLRYSSFKSVHWTIVSMRLDSPAATPIRTRKYELALKSSPDRLYLTICAGYPSAQNLLTRLSAIRKYQRDIVKLKSG